MILLSSNFCHRLTISLSPRRINPNLTHLCLPTQHGLHLLSPPLTRHNNPQCCKFVIQHLQRSQKALPILVAFGCETIIDSVDYEEEFFVGLGVGFVDHGEDGGEENIGFFWGVFCEGEVLEGEA